MINFHRKISKQQSFQQQRFFVSVNVEYQSHTLCHSFNSFFFFCYIYIHFISFRSIFLLTTFLNYFSPFFFSFFFCPIIESCESNGQDMARGSLRLQWTMQKTNGRCAILRKGWKTILQTRFREIVRQQM